MVCLAQDPVDPWGNIQCVVNGACRIEEHHTGNKDGQRQYMGSAGLPGCLHDQWGRGTQGQDHGDKMSQGTARIFNLQSHENTSFFKQVVFKTTYNCFIYYTAPAKKMQGIFGKTLKAKIKGE